MDPAEKIRHFLENLPTYDQRLPLESDTNLFSSGILDSISAIKLVMFIEKEFEIKVSPSDLVGSYFETILKICTYVEGKQESGNGK